VGILAVAERLRPPDLPPKQRLDLGRSLRAGLPRSSHGPWPPPPNRSDPLAILRQTNHGRLPHLVAHRYGRMAESMFAFLRGSAAVMAHDLAATPTMGLDVQLCGDAHIGNFGGYATPERALVFDLNDFDETFPGPWEWDVKRLAVSAAVLGRDLGLRPAACRHAALAAARGYRKAMHQFGTGPYLETWSAKLDAETAVDVFAGQASILEQAFARGRDRTHRSTLPKLVAKRGGRYRLVDEPPLITRRAPELRRHLDEALAAYRRSLPPDRALLLDRYTPVDVARKAVGIASVGLRCYVVFLQGQDEDDPLFLQVKEARESVLEPHLRRSPFSSHGRRIVAGQQIMQAASDPLLGWTAFAGHDFYVRQLRDMKTSVPLERLAAAERGVGTEIGGRVLARAHAASGDPAQIAGYLGHGDRFDRAVADFAESYANQVERDFGAFRDAIGKGTIRAVKDDR
jgi:uncharacterized protein (DUF2252 family)